MYKKRDREIEILNGTLSSVIIILREREEKKKVLS